MKFDYVVVRSYSCGEWLHIWFPVDEIFFPGETVFCGIDASPVREQVGTHIGTVVGMTDRLPLARTAHQPSLTTSQIRT